jgi:dipeptidyl aminopeptidase/acylaminoacyl peptidase
MTRELTTGRCSFPLFLALAAALQAEAQTPQTMSIVDLIEVPSISDPQLSPDGSQILFVRSDPDWDRNRTIGHVWRVAAVGGDPVQLTTGSEGQSSPRWSPGGGWIAFLAQRDEEDEGWRTREDDEQDMRTQIHLLNASGGEARPLTDHPTPVGSIQWSPDGAWIYYLAREGRTDDEAARDRARDDVFAYDEDWKHRHLWRVSVADGKSERVTSGDFTVRSYRLSLDGTRIAHHRAPNPLLDDSDDAEVWVMESSGARAVRITHNAVPEGGASLSPDNRTVLWVSGSDGDADPYFNDKIFMASASGDGDATRLLPDWPHEVSEAAWSADGRHIFFVANTGVRRELFRLGFDESEPEQLTRGDHQVTGWTYEPTTATHIFGLNRPTDPGEIHLMDADGRDLRQVTYVFDYLHRFDLPRQEAVTWLGEDGAEVEGILYYPSSYQEGRRYPLIVQTHGGPASSDKFGFPRSSRFIPQLATLGYVVFKPNYRGSTGYGDDFLRNMVGNYFDQAHLDVMTGVDALIERGIVDGDRMGKMGWSAGGHMTNKIITHTDRFRAAASGAGAANWVSMYAQSDVRIYRTPWFGGDPWTKDAPVEQYMADSPLFDAHRVTTPTIFLVGENDRRVPMPQSVEMWRALKANDVPTHLYVAPREGHGWRELRHRLFLSNVQLDWFERWVMEREWTWEEVPDGDEEEKAGVAAEAP